MPEGGCTGWVYITRWCCRFTVSFSTSVIRRYCKKLQVVQQNDITTTRAGCLYWLQPICQLLQVVQCRPLLDQHCIIQSVWPGEQNQLIIFWTPVPARQRIFLNRVKLRRVFTDSQRLAPTPATFGESGEAAGRVERASCARNPV